MKTAALIFLIVGLVSCATHKTAEDLTANPKTFRHTVPVAMNYQKAYRILTEKCRQCLQRSSVGNQQRTEENLNTNKQIGEIRFVNRNAFWGEDYFGYYVIKGTGPDKSELTTYHVNGALGSLNDNSDMLQSWLQGNESCNFVKKSAKR
jgi:hypothetical protein